MSIYVIYMSTYPVLNIYNQLVIHTVDIQTKADKI